MASSQDGPVLFGTGLASSALCIVPPVPGQAAGIGRTWKSAADITHGLFPEGDTFSYFLWANSNLLLTPTLAA